MQSYLTMMAVRLLEMHRVLKPTGSIYLHCDPTASHYLKLEMDAIFGKDACRNEITWTRTNTHNDSRHSFPNVADVILFYAMPRAEFTPQYIPHSLGYVKKSTDLTMATDAGRTSWTTWQARIHGQT